MSQRYDYDAIIIGAGISGLVCGCYVARAGMKTLIVEKNAKPGGYCTSFTREGFHFDACVHSFGGLRKGGNLRVILEELGLESSLGIKRYDPSDIIITCDHRVSFWNDYDKTVHEFQSLFPLEAGNIERFFGYISHFSALTSAGLLNKTFDELLNEYFDSKELMAVLALPVLGNAGLPPSMISAFLAVILYKEFILDGGYYPEKGIQALPDALAEKFSEVGGTIMFERLVNKIKVAGNKIEGVILDSEEFIRSGVVVSGIDARNTFLRLLGEDVLNDVTINKVKRMIPSLSAFSVFIGMEKCLEKKNQVNLWYLPNYDIMRIYSLINSCKIDHADTYFTLFHHGDTACLFVNAPFENTDFWIREKGSFTDSLTEKAKEVFPDLLNNIIVRFASTPVTLTNHTLNYKGATYGWACIPSQHIYADLSSITPFCNLFFTGHWTALAFGVSGVAFLGRKTALTILNKLTD